MGQIESGARKILALPFAYDLFQDFVGAQKARGRWVREFLKPVAGMRVLDIGCGTAEILQHIAPDVDYTGFDLSPDYIASARKRYGHRARFTCESVEAFSRGALDAGFDIAMIFGVIHHLNDAEASGILSSARAALKKTGRLVSIDPCFAPGQSCFTRWFVSLDRGRNVRAPEGYAALARSAFKRVEVSVWRGALRIPYDHAILVAEG